MMQPHSMTGILIAAIFAWLFGAIWLLVGAAYTAAWRQRAPTGTPLPIEDPSARTGH